MDVFDRLREAAKALPPTGGERRELQAFSADDYLHLQTCEDDAKNKKGREAPMVWDNCGIWEFTEPQARFLSTCCHVLIPLLEKIK